MKLAPQFSRAAKDASARAELLDVAIEEIRDVVHSLRARDREDLLTRALPAVRRTEPLRVAGARGRVPQLVPLTPWRHYLLYREDSPLLSPRAASPVDFIRGAYLCSAALEPAALWWWHIYRARWAYFAAVNGAAAVNAFRAWIQQSVGGGVIVSKPPQAGTRAAGEAWLGDTLFLGAILGFKPADTLHMPYARLWALHDAAAKNTPAQIVAYYQQERAAFVS